MSTAEERKKAREEYLATLQQQRAAAPASTSTAATGGSETRGKSSREDKMGARERMLEEKRKRFLEKREQAGGGGETLSGGVTAISSMGGGQRGGIDPPSGGVSTMSSAGGGLGGSLQTGKHGDDGASTLETRYGQKHEHNPQYRPKPQPKLEMVPPKPTQEDPFRSGSEPGGTAKFDPFAHTIRPQNMAAVNDPPAGGQLGSIGQLTSPRNDQESKRNKQAEYARQLKEDMGSVPQPQLHGGSNYSANDGGGLGNIGQPNPLNNKEAKRNKQAEYARQLKEDLGSQLPQQNMQHQQQHQAPSTYGEVGGLGSIGQPNPTNDKELKRNKQAEYARQLQQDFGSAPPQVDQRHRQLPSGNDGGGLSALGRTDATLGKDAKRAKQAEYARQLQQDNMSVGVNIQGNPANRQQQQGNNMGGGMFGGDIVDDKALKRAKQLEYNRQLQQDNSAGYEKNHSAQNQQHNPHDGGGYNLVTGMNDRSNNGNDSGMDPKAMKRAKQAEYNRQLQEHEQLKRQQEFARHNSEQTQLKNYHQQNPSQENAMNNQQTGSNGSLPDAGWEIGPLGQPVRKTLAVGNRGVQKAYTDRKHSPVKSSRTSGAPQQQNFDINSNSNYPNNFQPQGNMNGNGYQPNVMNNGGNFQQNGMMNGGNFQQSGVPVDNNYLQNGALQQNNDGGMFGGGAVNMFGNPPANIPSNNNQSEYARAIEEQIRIKKEGNEARKKAEAEEEERMYQKLEREREEMQKAFEEETKKKKIKEENERVAALELQIKQKQEQKIKEEREQKELDRKEDERLARDQAALNAQLQEELRRDKTLDTAAAKQLHQNSFDEQPVGAKNNSDMFRAPSPILDESERNKNMFKAPSSPINDNPFSPPKSPMLPAQRNKNVFQAPSPVLEDHKITSDRSKRDLFGSSPPSSPQQTYQQPKHSVYQKPSKVLSPPSSPAIRSRNQHSAREQRPTLDENHPVIQNLKKETASAKDEAAQARKELAQLRQLVSQDRKRQNNKSASPKKQKAAIPKLKVEESHNNEEEENLSRVDSARTFIRKYQRSYNADRPPAKPLRNNQMDNNPLEKSLKSDSFLHRPDIAMGSELPSDFHALMELDKTLKSESRFVYPDGRAFVGNSSVYPGADNRPGSSKPRAELKYNLQPYENAPTLPVKIPLPAPPRSPSTPNRKYELLIDETLNIPGVLSPSPLGLHSPGGSAVTLESERSKRRKDKNATPRLQDPDVDDELDFDVERAFRRNRRKWELLEKMGLRTEESVDANGHDMNVFSGPEELDLLMNGLQSVNSSRPTTAGTSKDSRPNTGGSALQGESQLLRNNEYGMSLQQERIRYKNMQQQQQPDQYRNMHARRQREPHSLPHHEQKALSRPSSSSSASAFSRSSSPKSPNRAHSQGSKIRKSNNLQASGRRAVGDKTSRTDSGGLGNSYNQLANTMQRAKFNDMVARRNSNIQEQMSTAFTERKSKDNQNDYVEKVEKGNDKHLYTSISAEQVHDIDFSDYGF